jgi:hypothetical protein
MVLMFPKRFHDQYPDRVDKVERSSISFAVPTFVDASVQGQHYQMHAGSYLIRLGVSYCML